MQPPTLRFLLKQFEAEMTTKSSSFVPKKRAISARSQATSRSCRQSSNSLMGVQALRAFAALLVVFHHYNGTAQARGFGIELFEGSVIGNIGVDVFFVVSGFIMKLTARQTASPRADAIDFIARRLIRILPLYWFLTVAAFVASSIMPTAINRTPGFHEFVSSMLLLPSTAADGSSSYVIGIAWTLSYELYFYFLFAGLLASGFSSNVRLATLAAVFTISVGIGKIIKPQSVYAQIAINPILFEFWFGCFLATLFKRGIRISRNTAKALILVATLLMIIQYDRLAPDALRILVWGTPAAMLVYATVLAKEDVWRNLTVLRPIARIGDISYSLYLSHFFSIAIFVRLQARFLSTLALPPWATAILLFGFCLALAAISYALLENWTRKRLTGWWNGLSPIAMHA